MSGAICVFRRMFGDYPKDGDFQIRADWGMDVAPPTCTDLPTCADIRGISAIGRESEAARGAGLAVPGRGNVVERREDDLRAAILPLGRTRARMLNASRSCSLLPWSRRSGQRFR